MICYKYDCFLTCIHFLVSVRFFTYFVFFCKLFTGVINVFLINVSVINNTNNTNIILTFMKSSATLYIALKTSCRN